MTAHRHRGVLQGHEYKVLRGAQTLFEKYGVDYVYIEFTGAPRKLAGSLFDENRVFFLACCPFLAKCRISRCH